MLHHSESNTLRGYRRRIGHDVRGQHLREGAMKQQLGRKPWPVREGLFWQATSYGRGEQLLRLRRRSRSGGRSHAMDEADSILSDTSRPEGTRETETYLYFCLQQKLTALSGAMFPLCPRVQVIHLFEGCSPLQKGFWWLREWHGSRRGQWLFILIGSHAF